jgi:RNA polymerase sigma factor (sigma-70 family)
MSGTAMRPADETPDESGGLVPSDREMRAFWDVHSHPVLTALWAMTGDEHVAREARHVAFVRAYLNWATVSEFQPGRQRGWLIVVGKNWVRDEWRRAGRQARLMGKVGVSPASGSRSVEDVEAAADVRHAVESLPQRQREVIAMSFLADLDDSEIAEALGVSLGAVASSRHRGLKALRHLLGDREGGGGHGR